VSWAIKYLLQLKLYKNTTRQLAKTCNNNYAKNAFRSRVRSTSSSTLLISLHHTACDTALIFQCC